MECYWALILSIFTGIVGVWYLIYRNVNFFKRKGIPYVKGTPFLGNMGPIVRGKLSITEMSEKLYNMHPDVKYVGFHDFMTPVVMLRDPELIKSVTIKNFNHFHDRQDFVDKKLDPLFSKTILLLKGQRWHDVRSLLTPSFTSSKMKMMFKLVSKCASELADFLIAEASQPIDLETKDIFARYTNDVIASVAFGISINSLKDRDNEFYMIGRRATEHSGIKFFKFMVFRCSPFLARFFKLKVISDKIDRFYNAVMSSTVAIRDEKGIVRNDMIQLMMQARERNKELELTTQEMTSQAFIFFFAGLDTSSTLISFVAHQVAINPAIQEELQAEIDAVLTEGQGEVTYEALHGMRYLDAVINEVLRIYAPAPVVNRYCTKAFELPPAAPGLPPFTMEVGSIIWLPIHGLHRDPKYFPDPEKFDPSRFSDENKGNIPPFAYIPFGLGPRSCIGGRFALMEVKLAVFYLFAKCNVSPCSKTSIPIKFDTKNANSSAANGVWLRIQGRS